jgi:O-antigen ligase
VEAWQWRQALLLLVAFQLPFGHAALGMILLVILVAGEVIAGEPVWVRTPFDAGLSSLVLIALVSGLLSEWRSNAVPAAAVFGLSAFVIVRAVALASLRQPKFPAWFLSVWAGAGVLASAWAIARMSARLGARARLPGFGYNELGITLAIVLVLLVGFSLEGSRRSRLLAAAALPLPALGLVLTWSRGAWLGALLGLPVVLARLSKPRRWISLAAVIIPIIVAAPFLAPRWSWHLERLRGIAVAEGPFSRVALWRVVPRMVSDHPLLGTGLATFQFAYERYRQQSSGVQYAPFAHNLFLNFAAETGLLGLAAVALMLGSCLATLIRWHRRTLNDPPARMRSAMVLAAFVTLMAQQMVDGTVMRVHLAIGLFALMGFGAAGDRSTRPAGAGH